ADLGAGAVPQDHFLAGHAAHQGDVAGAGPDVQRGAVRIVNGQGGVGAGHPEDAPDRAAVQVDPGAHGQVVPPGIAVVPAGGRAVKDQDVVKTGLGAGVGVGLGAAVGPGHQIVAGA